MLVGWYNVGLQASIKVNALQGVSLTYLTATQGGALRMADFCMLIASSSIPYRLIDLVIDDHNQQCDRSHCLLRRW